MAMDEMTKSGKSVKKEILMKLMSSNGLRYTQGKPEDVENDLYNYHLQHLVKKGLVTKQNDLYLLTDSGKKHIEVNEALDAMGHTAQYFRVTTLLILLDYSKGGLLVLGQERRKHPNYGDKGVISGPVGQGELIPTAANRILREETGLEASFTTIGVLRLIRNFPQNELFSDVVFPICVAQKYTGHLKLKNQFGINTWISIDQAIRNEKNASRCSRALVNKLTLLKTKKPSEIPFFFEEEITDLDSI